MRLVWTKTAANDLDHVRAFIGEENPLAATKVVAAIRHATERLLSFPESGRPGRLPNTRELRVPGLPFFLPYTVLRNRVVILAVIHSSRRWPPTT